NASDDPFRKTLNGLAARLYGNPVPPAEVLGTNTFYQWCLLAFLQHPDAALFRARAADSPVDFLPVLPADTPFSMGFLIDDQKGEPDAPAAPATEEEECPVDQAQVTRLEAQIAYEYPYRGLTTSLSKRSASHLGEKPFSTQYFAETRPESLSREGMTPAERGTCLHKFMQYADFALAAEDPAAEKERLVEKGFLLPEEAAVVEPEQVHRFFASSLAARIKKSPRVLREQKFAILLPAGQFDDTLSPEEAREKVLIQGIIDCAFEEENGFVLLDYKTDRVSDGEDLKSRYREQLALYKLALEETLGLPVREVALWSFHLGEEVLL
ncbi:MAG: PD-(D/E)XK nuclease family protein, partial [Clostridia bacterium]|nr:PD-(D/E)XK nuclease family protein [Clostridia bacterium]